MSRTLPRLFAPLFVGLCAVGGSSPALAAEPMALDRVEVSGGTVRTDVTRTCPAIQETLAEHLARAMIQVGTDHEYQVRFELRPDGVGRVETLGSMDYRPAIRRAVHYLQCQDSQVSAARSQHFAFVLSIKASESEGGGAARFAVRELPAQAALAP